MDDSALHERLRALFEEAVDLTPEAQDAFLDRLQASEEGLAGPLRRLLARDRDSGSNRLRAHEVSAREATEALNPAPVRPGRRIGSFEVLEQIGAGGMGSVFRVIRRDGQVEQQAALKLVRPDVLNPELLRRFSAERRMLAALDHSGVCRFLDAGVLPEGTPWVLMELVEGEHLLAHCDRHRLGIEMRLRLLRKVLAAVDHAHRNLVVHRDIKSANVLVNADGEPKLLDFGIAKSLASGEPGVTATADRFLTPLNAAPEQVLGKATGIACDIYQLGLLAYELLCGEPPFALAGLRAAEVERLILEHPPAAMSQRKVAEEAAQTRGLSNGRALCRRLSGDLDAIVLRCLRKAPGERYASVAELDADIARALEGRAVKARGGDRLYRLSRFVARHRVAVGLSAALFVTVLGGSVALAWQALEASRQRDTAVQERDRAQHAVAVLRDAFAAADPARSAGADVRARHILDAARERIEPLFEAQPALYAELALILAEVELDLAAEAEAAELAKSGLQVAARADPETARALRLLSANLSIKAGDHEAAKAMLENVEAENPGFHPDLAVMQAKLAVLEERTDDSVVLLERVIVAMDDRDAHNEAATQVRWELGAALRAGGRFRESLEVYGDILAWQRRVLPDEHPRVLLTKLRRFSVELESSSDYDEALRAFERTFDLIIRHYGERSSMAALAHSLIGPAHARAGRHEAAIDHYRQALAGQRASLGADHANTLRTMLNLAVALGTHGRNPEEAEQIFREALALGERRFGPDRDLVVYTRSLYVRFLGRQRGRWEEALELAVAPDGGLGVVSTRDYINRWQWTALGEVAEHVGCHRSPVVHESACARAAEILRMRQRASSAEKGSELTTR